jgi:hypothetical protein
VLVREPLSRRIETRLGPAPLSVVSSNECRRKACPIKSGVAEHHADRSVLAKHYVDLWPSKLKQVLAQAGLRVLPPKAPNLLRDL